MTKTQITINYEDDSPITSDGSLRIDRHCADLVIEPHLFTLVSHDADEGEIVVELDIPDRGCRFLGHSDGSPPCCYYGLGNGSYMEDCYPGQAYEIICFHCAEYALCREERILDRETRLDDRGYRETLPELTQEEASQVNCDYFERPGA